MVNTNEMNEDVPADEVKLLEEQNQPSKLGLNAETLSREVHWFAQVVNARLKNHFPEETIEIVQEEPQNWLGKIFGGKGEIIRRAALK